MRVRCARKDTNNEWYLLRCFLHTIEPDTAHQARALYPLYGRAIVYVNGIFASSVKCIYVDMQTRALVSFLRFSSSPSVSHCDVFRIWFAIVVALFYLTRHHLYLFCHFLLLPLLHWFVINYSRNSLPEYVNMEWSPLWLVNRIHEHSVNSCIFEMPTWYWMVPSSSNAYFSTEHSSDCYRNWKEKKLFKIKLYVLYRLPMIEI